jgi:2-methylisocitrate lyase-like PEP mutase family enzyme
MMNPAEKANRFRALHIPGQPLVLFNIWDAGSAKAVAAGGASAIATGSWSVANANGYSDGEATPLEFAFENLVRITSAVDLPVTVDLESGYAETPDGVGRVIERSIEAGAIGCNLEDSFPENGRLRDLRDQVARISQAREIADRSNPAYFINARTDVFFQSPPETHDGAMLEEALERASAYAEAGASGIFAPGLSNPDLIARFAHASPLPLNIMVDDRTPPTSALAALGVARVSYGPRPFLAVMNMLEVAARDAMQGR